MATIPLLIVAHGGLGRALVEAARDVSGDVSGIEQLSNESLSSEALAAEIHRRIESWPEGGIVLCDLPGGSTHTRALSASRGVPGVEVITGGNLPMLLFYLSRRDELLVHELAAGMCERGQKCIRAQRADAP